ncbi:MAG: FAD-binding oxidoreductase [Actinobacteria bacterium]|nr:FAD-binding oxidoreductase [Actinomycetota bacterium]
MLHMTGLDGEPVDVAAKTLDSLSARLKGRMLEPSDDGFDEAIEIWNGMRRARPALVVQPISTGDVCEAIGFARANGIRLSVKGGGHHIAGTALAQGGLTLDMSRLKSVEVDPERRRAVAGAGCLLGDVDRATQQHGLATVLGSDANTGVAGLTLGGGFGYLSRRHGWTVDNVDEIEIVTADGQVRRAADDEHEDLFWALRGGGGNFGVVTRFSFRLHEVGPEITGGLVVWDAEHADDVVALYRDVTEASPRELTLVLVMRLAPPVPFIPERWHGRAVVGLLACHTGDPSQAVEDLAEIRTFGQPIADLIVPKPYLEQQARLVVPQPKGMHYYWKSEFLAALPDEALRSYQHQAAAITSPMSMVILFQLGGAIADHPPGATAFGHRDATHIFFAAGSWPPDTADPERHQTWARSASDAIRPYSTGGNYINVQTADEDETRMQAAYPDSLNGLRKVKTTYDPDNLFRVNRNISAVAP